MTKRKKACVVTGTRAEYGLLYWLMKEIQLSKKLDLQVIATGMHLSPEFGLTYQQIEDDYFTIDKKIEMLLSSDTAVGVTKSMGVGLIGFADAFNDLKPDLIILLGDRFETLIATTAAMVANIPVAHLHGGEVTEGAFDEYIRHSITKMSHLHFVAAEQYRKRVIQLGEIPNKVFNVGALGIDNIKKLKLLSKKELEESIQFKLGKRNLLVTFHPVTLENSSNKEQLKSILSALEKFGDINIIFTRANADTSGRAINKLIDGYVAKHKQSSTAFTSLGQLRYLSAMQYIDGVVGNSSSGLLEAPSFKIGTINIGDRQKGRIRASSIIDCDVTEESITKALSKLFSDEFNLFVKNTKSPFGNGGAAKSIVNVIESISLDGIVKKPFYDLTVPIST